MKATKFSSIAFSVVLIFLNYQAYSQISGSLETPENIVEFIDIDNYVKVKLNYSDQKKITIHTQHKYGEPEIPVVLKKYVVPLNAINYEFQITGLDSILLAGDYLLYPEQPPLSCCDSSPEWVDPDPVIYQSAYPYPGKIIEVYKEESVMGYKILTVALYPVSFIPLDQQITLYDNISFTILYSTQQGGIQRPERISSYRNSLVVGFIESIISNVSDLEFTLGGAQEIINWNINTGPLRLETTPGSHGHVPDYIIITTKDLNGQDLEDFALWKTKKGTVTTIVTLEEINQKYWGADQAERIFYYLQDAFKFWGPLFVLLVGDTEIVPDRLAYLENNQGQIFTWKPTDLYYSDVYNGSSSPYNWNENGNLQYGEVEDNIDEGYDHFVGRIPVSNITELQSVLDRTKIYEDMLLGQRGAEYIYNLLFFQAFLWKQLNGIPYGTYADETNDVIVDILDENDMFYPWRVYDNEALDDEGLYPTWYEFNEELSSDAAINRLNGIEDPISRYFHFVFHGDHSDMNKLGTSVTVHGDFIDNNRIMDELENHPFYFILYSHGCRANSFHANSSVGNAFFKNPNGGAVALIGATAITTGIHEWQYHSLFLNKTFVMNSDLPVSELMYEAHVSTTISSFKRKYALLGDPELYIWTEVPDEFTGININPPDVYTGENNIIIEIEEYQKYINLKICAYKEDEVYDVETEPNHTGQFIVECTPNTPGNIEITITAKNKLPAYLTIPVTTNSEAHLYISDFSNDDDKFDASDGNGDGLLDAGETIELDLTLRNSGDATATNVLAEIDVGSSSSGIQVIQGSSVFDDIPPMMEVGSDSKYEFSIDNDLSDLSQIYLTFDFSYDLESTCTDKLFFTIHAAELDITGIEILTENNDEIIEAGELIYLFFECFNHGSGEATGIQANITSTSAYIDEIISPTQFYGNIAANSYVKNVDPFEFTVDNEYYGETIKLNVSLINVYDKEWHFNDIELDIPDKIIDGLAYEGDNNNIFLYWNEEDGIRGYNIYRSNTDLVDDYHKINPYIVEGYPGYYDNDLQNNTTYYYKVCVVSHFGIEGPLSSALEVTISYIAQDHPGWPVVEIATNEFGDKTHGSPMAFDIDSDGTKEIFFTIYGEQEGECNRGGIFGFHHNGIEIFDIDNNPESCSGYYKYVNTGSSSTPAIGDINNDMIPEIVSATKGEDGNFDRQKVFVHSSIDEDDDGKPDLLWKKLTNISDQKGVVLSDLNNDGTLEIITVFKDEGVEKLHVFDSQGNDFAYWPQKIGPLGNGLPTAADINNDGFKEVIMGCVDGIYVINYDGTQYQYSNSEHRFFYHLEGESYDRMDSPVSITHVDEDEYYDLVCVSGRYNQGNSIGIVFVLNNEHQYLTGWEYDEIEDHIIVIHDYEYGELFLPATSLGDFNNDGDVEVVVVAKNSIHSWLLNGTNAMVYSEGGEDGFEGKFIVPLIADIDLDYDIEIIVATNKGANGRILALNPDGSKAFDQSIREKNIDAPPCIDDIDRDGKNEIILTSANEIYVWDTEGDADKIEWGKYRHDSYNSGVYGDFCPYYTDPLKVLVDQEWNRNKVLNRDVVVKDNATLTITSNVAFPENAMLIIEPGGKVILDGGTLTSACKEPWKGVEVWGNPYVEQIENDQGMIVINGGTIEHAEIGIHVGNSETHYSHEGGIVIAAGATFKNNGTAVIFRPYEFRNSSHFFPM